MNQFERNLYNCLAFTVVWEQQQEWWPVKDAVGFDFGGTSSGTSSTSTTNDTFARAGTTTSGSQYALPSWLSALIQQAPNSTTMPQNVQNADWSMLLGLLGQDPTQVAGKSVLDQLITADPTTYNGVQALDNIIARNPYSTDFEQAMQGLFQRQFGIARADAQSGPQNVRGGQARQGFELADIGTQSGLHQFQEVLGQQNKEAGIVEQATHIANMIESMRRGSTIQAAGTEQSGEHMRTGETTEASSLLSRGRANNAAYLQLAGELLGTKESQEIDNLKGSGQQIQNSSGTSSGQQFSSGVNCCFIFLQALNGELPDFVRKARDYYYTPNRRRGYVWMSTWLVPLMRKSTKWQKWVNRLMVQPMLPYGEFVMEHTGSPVLAVLSALVVYFWFLVWSACGWLKRNDNTIKL